jgi:hypothetical protein
MRVFLCLLCFIGCPLISQAAVSISEIAWMGDTVSANYEWIELHNSGEAVSVDGWVLRDGMNLTITLAGTIPARSYVTLERNRTSGSYTIATPFLIYTGALVNTGATLVLATATGEVVDRVAGGTDWQDIGGDNVTKETAQYTSAGWRTGTPTPGQAPGVTTVTPLPTSTSTPRTNTTSGGSSKKSDTIKFVIPPNDLKLVLDVQKVAYVNQLVPLRAVVSGVGTTTRNSLVYNWNFGDLSTSSAKEPAHVYRHPGTYVVILEAAFGAQYQLVRHEITILPVLLTLARTESGDVLLHNDAPYDVDVSAYRIRGTVERLFPPHTIVTSKSTLTINQKSIGATALTPIVLLDRMRIPVATWPHYPAVSVSATPQVTLSVAPASRITNTPTNLASTSPGPTVVLETGDFAAPLVLLPTPGVASAASSTTSMPEYVTAAFLFTAPAPATETIYWPYLALLCILALAMGSIVATSSNMSSRTDKITTDGSAMHSSVDKLPP